MRPSERVSRPDTSDLDALSPEARAAGSGDPEREGRALTPGQRKPSMPRWGAGQWADLQIVVPRTCRDSSVVSPARQRWMSSGDAARPDSLRYPGLCRPFGNGDHRQVRSPRPEPEECFFCGTLRSLAPPALLDPNRSGETIGEASGTDVPARFLPKPVASPTRFELVLQP